MRFKAFIEDLTPLTVVPTGPAEIKSGVALMRKYSDQDLTLADAMGLQLMATRKLRQCWSTDFHLGLGGAALVINQ